MVHVSFVNPFQSKTMLPRGESLLKMLPMMLVVILICVALGSGQGYNCGDIGNKPRCECFPNTHLAVCRNKIRSVPTFGQFFMDKLNWIDLRFNRIKTINHERKKELAGVKLDLRENPVDCNSLPQWENILSHCQESTTESSTSITMTQASITVTDGSTSISFSTTDKHITTSEFVDVNDTSEFWISVTLGPSLIMYCVGTVLYCLRRRLRELFRIIRGLFSRNLGTDLEMEPLYNSSGSTTR